MPTYDYVCEACGERFEIFHGMTESPRRKCPACGRLKLRRQIGTGAGILFRGSGFYQTDYRSESYKKGAEAEKKAAEPSSDGKPPGSKAEKEPSKPKKKKDED